MIETSEDINKNILPNAKFCCTPINRSFRKLAALTCFEKGDIDAGIHHLTESHAIGFRRKILSHIDGTHAMQAKYMGRPHISFDPELISFSSDYAVAKEKGLMKRLRELPEEWTLVQLTQGFAPKIRCTPREAGTAGINSVLHITRFSCGPNARKPCCVTLPETSVTAENMSTVFNIIEESLSTSTKKSTPSKMLREICIPDPRLLFPNIKKEPKTSRETYSETLKILVDDINKTWLQQWRCLFLGRLYSSDLQSEIRNIVDDVLAKCKSKLGENEVSILYQIVDGSGHLDGDEIKAAVSDCIRDEATCSAMIKAITNFKESNLHLPVERRYPVLLILDEMLDRIPWEMIPVIRRHPVSRIFSVHFAHAAYKRFKVKEKYTMKDGCFVLKKPKDGYYIINPGKDLDKMEEKMNDFVSSRVPSWKGVSGSFPSDDEFSSALRDRSLLLYCGHGNGTQFYSSDAIFGLNVKAVPLLFGCSSVKMEDFGGRVSLSGLAMKYFTAGSPCVIGMLWRVTSNDADNMCITLLNNWLPNENSVDVSGFIAGGIEINIKSEPELLRNLKYARESCVYFTNSAALVVYGLPVVFS